MPTRDPKQRSTSDADPRLPRPMAELCGHLEEQGIQTYWQGERLLAALADEPARVAESATLLCTTTGEALRRAAPRAIPTADRERRLTQATTAGPVDLLPIGASDPGQQLARFGLSAYGFARRPADGRWLDPFAARAAFVARELDLITTAPLDPSVFARAPRRFWLAARIVAEHGLEPTPRLIESARAALAESGERRLGGAPARRAAQRILAARGAAAGLRLLHSIGLSEAMFPGIDPRGPERVAALPALPALRFAAWLAGSSVMSSIVSLRMPQAIARRVEALIQVHPIDQTVRALREVGLRRILNRLTSEEIEGLLAWRRLELADAPPSPAVTQSAARLDEIEARLQQAQRDRERVGRVRTLAIDGHSVMTALGAGPGPHVGRALAHLALWIESEPEGNERERLLAELRRWAEEDAATPSIG